MTALPDSRYFDRKTPPHITTLVLLVAIPAASLNIFLASLPAMAEYYQTSYAIMQFTVSGYLALTGFVQLFIGPVSDRYGRRPVMLWILALFILASLGAALAETFELFLLFRCLQAVITTGFVISRASVRDVTSREKAASVIGYVTMGMALVPMLSPPLGGLLSDLFGWQSNFYALFIGGCLVFFIAFMDQGETNQHKSASFGAQFKAYPELLTSRRFWGYTLTMVFASGTFYAYLGGAPFVGERFFGLSATEVGVYLSLTPLGYMLGNGVSGRFSISVGLYRMILFGACVTLGLMSVALVVGLSGVVHPLGFFAFTISIGFGNGMILPSANAGLLDVRPNLAGSASGLSGAMMTFGGAGLTVLSSFVLRDDSNAVPLILCVIGSAACCLLSALYTIRIEKQMRQKSKSA